MMKKLREIKHYFASKKSYLLKRILLLTGNFENIYLNKLKAQFLAQNQGLLSRPEKKGLKILFINHYFDQDIAQLRRARGDHSIALIEPQIFAEIALAYFPEKFEIFEEYAKTKYNSAKKAHRRMARKMIELLRSIYPFDIVMSTSEQFYWIREIVFELKDRNIPFIVADKEGTIHQMNYLEYPNWVKNYVPFIGDHLLVWSERHRRLWEISGVNRSRISITGQLRSDFWKHPDLWLDKKSLGIGRPGAKTVVFFSFHKILGIPVAEHSLGVNNEKHFYESHETFFNLASQFPEVDFIIKTHPQQENINEIKSMISKRGGHNVIHVQGAAITNQLLVNSDLIIGYLTTALIEAMMCEKPIIYLFWGAITQPKYRDINLPLHACSWINIAKSPEDYMLLAQTILNDLGSQKQKYATHRSEIHKFIDQYFYGADGRVAERTWAVIDRFFRGYNKKTAEGSGV